MNRIQKSTKENKRRPKVAIVGGGFGGLYAAKSLANKPVDVILIDRKNHHTFQPLLYQVALSVLAPNNISSSLRGILRAAKNVEVVLGEVTGFDTARRKVKLEDGAEFAYDYLIVAAGARHAYFGRDEWAQDAPGLKTLEDAEEIRSRILLAFEKAEREAILTGAEPPLNFAVIGGGPTGVELAGAIADLARLGLARDFRAIDTRRAAVTLYEAAPRVLGTYSQESSRRAEEQLQELGVEVRADSLVTEIETRRLKVGDRWLPADVIIWATGVAASPLGKALGAETDRAGRVLIETDLSLPGDKNIFVIGDMASLVDADGQQVPGLGAAAMQEGKAAAENILRDLRGRPRAPFRYDDRGNMATIGHHRAVAEIRGWKFSGAWAWLLWSIVHVFLLIGFRNRLTVTREWLWAYFKREGSTPLITEHGRDRKLRVPVEFSVPEPVEARAA
ncbi:MAG TPA: NAD(P)/FAD-dependent oxidoreductase [Pyrinomonadaceae bacterium]|jgi:NADH dehydrogenase